MKAICNDMFLGLSKMKMSGMRFFVYQILIQGVTFVLGILIYPDINQFQAIAIFSVFLLAIYSDLNITAKRFRDIGVGRAWLLTIVLFITQVIALTNIDNEYISYAYVFSFIIFLALIPKNFTNN